MGHERQTRDTKFQYWVFRVLDVVYRQRVSIRAVCVEHLEIIMKTDTGKFSFAIPDGHAQAGEKVNKTFEFKICETEQEAQTVMTEKKWSLITMVNDNLKANARSNAYQAALLPYKPSEVSPEDIKERMIRDYIRMGVPESAARSQVDSLLANLAAPVTA